MTKLCGFTAALQPYFRIWHESALARAWLTPTDRAAHKSNNSVERTFVQASFAASLVLFSAICACNTSQQEPTHSTGAPVAHERKPPTAQRSDILLRASVALEELVKNPENAIPSAILNRTKCLVFVPRQFGASAGDVPGIESCRDSENSWSSPLLVQFTIAPKYQMEAGDFFLLLDEKASQQLLRGELKLDAAAGPTIRDANLATNAELAKDTWTYVRVKGSLV